MLWLYRRPYKVFDLLLFILPSNLQDGHGHFHRPSSQGAVWWGGKHPVSARVGVDGASCGKGILQTGFDINVNGISVSYDDGTIILSLTDLPAEMDASQRGTNGSRPPRLASSVSASKPATTSP